MTDKGYHAVIDAIERLVRGLSTTTNGKLIPVNVAREAGISKASLYRYFERYDGLRKEFDEAQKQGVRVEDRKIITVQDSLAAATTEARELRRRLTSAERELKIRDQQIFLLWSDNKELSVQLKKARETTEAPHVTSLEDWRHPSTRPVRRFSGGQGSRKQKLVADQPGVQEQDDALDREEEP